MESPVQHCAILAVTLGNYWVLLAKGVQYYAAATGARTHVAETTVTDRSYPLATLQSV